MPGRRRLFAKGPLLGNLRGINNLPFNLPRGARSFAPWATRYTLFLAKYPNTTEKCVRGAPIFDP